MIKLYAFLLVSLGLITGCGHSSSQKTSQKSSKSKYEDMRCAGNNIYVDSKMSTQQTQQFLQVVKQSKQDIVHFFGGMRSNPKIYACTTNSCFRKFGGVPSRAKAIGDDTVLLSSKGLDKVTLTHELVHVEFHKRLGSAKSWNRVPMWFDEGLAVLVCKDPKHERSVAMMSLQKLVSQEQWISAVRDRIPAYTIAKQAVQSWYSKAGTHGLQSMITRLQKGNSFASSLASSYPVKSELRISGL